MSDRLKTLREKRTKTVTDMRGITDAAAAENRDLSGEELAQHSSLYKAQDDLRQQIEAVERQVELDRQLATAAGDQEERRRDSEGGGDTREDRAMTAFRGYLRTGRIAGDGADELRAMTAGRDTEGGFIVAPQQFVTTLLQGLDSELWFRQAATVHQIGTAGSLGVPTLDDDMDDADWTSELRTGRDDDGIRFGKRELMPNALAKRVKVSKSLIRRSILPVESIVMQRLVRKFSVTAEKAYLLGDGNKKPLGVFTPSTAGISTARDVATGNTTAAPTFDGLIEAKYALKSQYWPKAVWVFHQDVVKILTKIKDNDGNYVWRQGVREGEPDTILGRPLRISDYAPNSLTAGAYVGLFADLSCYWIADALDMQIQRLVELYAETNQDGFIGRLESDGMPVLEEAFARVQLAA